MKANLRFMLVALCAIVVGVKGNGQMCTSRASRDGILMPSRGSLLSLNTFKQKVRNIIITKTRPCNIQKLLKL